MSSLLRNIIAAVVAVISGALTVTVAESITASMYPPPAGLNPRSMADVPAIMAAMPNAAFICIALGHALGAFVAGFVAFLICSKKSVSLICGGIFMAMGLLNFVYLSGQPTWFYAELLVYIPSALLGANSARKLKTARANA